VPARIEVHPALSIREYLHPLGIERVEPGVGKDLPVRTVPVRWATGPRIGRGGKGKYRDDAAPGAG
jgi:hypothetical protein